MCDKFHEHHYLMNDQISDVISRLHNTDNTKRVICGKFLPKKNFLGGKKYLQFEMKKKIWS